MCGEQFCAWAPSRAPGSFHTQPAAIRDAFAPRDRTPRVHDSDERRWSCHNGLRTPCMMTRWQECRLVLRRETMHRPFPSSSQAGQSEHGSISQEVEGTSFNSCHGGVALFNIQRKHGRASYVGQLLRLGEDDMDSNVSKRDPF